MKDAFREVEEILKASHTGDPEEILRRLEGQQLRPISKPAVGVSSYSSPSEQV